MMWKTIRIVALTCFLCSSFAEREADEDFLKYINYDVDPCDDFYEYTCGNFNKLHPLSPGVTTIDEFSILQDKIINLLENILSSEDQSYDSKALKKARAVYKACVDTDYMDLFTDPEKQIVEELKGYPIVEPSYLRKEHTFGWNDVADAVGKYGVHMLLTITISPSYLNASKNLIYIQSDKGSNPEVSFRPEQGDDHEVLMEKGLGEMADGKNLKSRGGLKPFDIFLRKLALKIQKSMRLTTDEVDVSNNIDEMANFMKGVFLKGYIPENVTVPSFPTSEVEITLDLLNQWTRTCFGDEAGIEWIEYMRRIFKNSGIYIDGDTTVMVTTDLPALLYGIINWVRMNDDNVVKSFVMTRIFLYNSLDSDQESRDMLEEYYTKINLKIPPRWEYCVKKVTDLGANAAVGLSFALAYEYQLHYFNVNKLSQAAQMVLDLKSSFQELIGQSTWMDDSCKQKALVKLDKMTTILGYPELADNKTEVDKFYENLRVCKWDNYGNTLNLRAFMMAYQYSQVLKRDRATWTYSPFRINAFYNRPNNRIIFPVAILNPIFFGTDSSILDYGRIGSIIGHEITHGFDKAGSLYDEDGQYTPDVWSKEIREAFTNKSQCFVDQYGQYYMPQIDSYVNSATTLNENIADNGGVRESFRAMKRLLGRSKSNSLHNYYNYTDEQLFFMGFGSLWCNNPSTAYLLEQKDQEHSPSKWRVNGVLSNMVEFSTAFNCPAGSKMNPEKKCILF